LGVSLGSGTVLPERVATALGSKPVLLLLDNCEHVIEEAARLADALLRVNLYASVIATSREPLRIDGEYTSRVPSLEVPPEGTLYEDAILHRFGLLTGGHRTALPRRQTLRATLK